MSTMRHETDTTAHTNDERIKNLTRKQMKSARKETIVVGGLALINGVDAGVNLGIYDTRTTLCLGITNAVISAVAVGWGISSSKKYIHLRRESKNL
jgi:hypothetical protein